MFFFQEGNPDPVKIIEETRLKFSAIRDFTAEVEIEIQVDFINIPNKQAKVFYRYPGKFKFTSPSFIMIPKNGIGLSVFELLENHYSAIYAGWRNRNGMELSVIKVIPMAGQPEIALASLYIDPEEDLIYYMEATTTQSGFFTSEFVYGTQSPLPDINRIQFEVDKMDLPMKFLGDEKVNPSKEGEVKMGEVILRFDRTRSIGDWMKRSLRKTGTRWIRSAIKKPGVGE
jgi:hypothetical protein